MSTSADPVEPSSAEAELRLAARAGSWLIFALVASLTYAIDRTVAALSGAMYDPLAAVASARIDYFWRMPMAAFVGSLAAFGWPRLVGARAPVGLRWLMRALWPTVALCTLLSVLWP